MYVGGMRVRAHKAALNIFVTFHVSFNPHVTQYLIKGMQRMSAVLDGLVPRYKQLLVLMAFDGRPPQ